MYQVSNLSQSRFPEKDYQEIMDMKLYDLNDMVKACCNDCKGCSDCCFGMGQSILLDPYDIWQLETHLQETFAGLMREKIELHMEDKLILPNLKMQGKAECCGFLSREGRCGIHSFRPGLCRLFPLGRNYGEQGLQYFLLEDACSKERTKIKVKKWLDIPDGRQYTDFLIKWHDLRKGLQAEIAGREESEPEAIKERNMELLYIFYEEQYEPADFYGQFEERLRRFYEIRTAD
ncbi:MAG: YkgJ family cysteine cluster protein [Blautia sp.]|nr:YkgJ family cysteine cluster protein [Blautia sp.]MCM1200653.1 YkgJ family cysteine cluster protein [Bacteroides fragilis]